MCIDDLISFQRYDYGDLNVIYMLFTYLAMLHMHARLWYQNQYIVIYIGYLWMSTWYGSGPETVAVLLPGFAIMW